MTDAERILQRLDEIDKRLDDYDDLVVRLGCAIDENIDADKTAREIIKGAKSIARLMVILAAIGRFVLMVGGMFTVAAALLNGWRGGP